MLNISVAGGTGRMGTRIASLAVEAEDLHLHSLLERSGHSAVGTDAGTALGLGPLGVSVTDDLNTALEGADVLIDFTAPEATLRQAAEAAKRGVALVIGTTGLTDEALAAVRGAAENTAVVFAPNMSVGVNLLFKVLGDVARVLGDDYDVEIIEAHHRMKKDAPSGTALKMAQVVAEALERNLDEVGVYERKGIIGARSPREIGVQTVRAGDIVGEHTVLFGGLGERIEITHKASSRDTFARGALRAARWVSGKAPGLYTMQQVLGIV